MPKLQQSSPVTYGDALERIGLKLNLPKYSAGVYQTVCPRCDHRRRCAASKFYEPAPTALSPHIHKTGFCVTFMRNGYNPSGHSSFHNGRVV